MRLDGFDIFVIAVPRRAGGPGDVRRDTRSILVRVHDETGLSGWGESPVGNGADANNVEHVRDSLRDVVLPALAALEFDDLDSVGENTAAILKCVPREAYPGFCGAELALLDLMGRRLRRSAGDAVGPVRIPELRYSGIIAGDNRADVRSQSVPLRRAGVREVKLKVGVDLDRNLSLLDVVRQILGPEVELRIDVGGRWDRREATRQLEAMIPFRLAGVEQPVPASDIAGFAEITAAGFAPVIARDGISTVGDAVELAACRVCDTFSVNISQCGGLSNAARVHRVARGAGLGCQLGASEAEVGVLAAAGRLFATRSEGVRGCESSPCLARMAGAVTDIPAAPDLAQPTPAPKGYGLGIRILEAAVEKYASQRISVS